MNPYQRQAIARKTGVDPMAPKLTLPDKWDLIHSRTGQVILTDKPRALCQWKKKEQMAINPLSQYTIVRSR